MRKDTALLVAGIIFSVITGMHLLRIIYQFEIVIAGYRLPIWTNFIGMLIALVLAIWMFSCRD